MLELNELTGPLSRWAPGENPEANYAYITTHPRFQEAIRELHRGKVATVAEDKSMIGIFRDAGHYLATLWALSLHAEGNLTLPRLKSVCSTSRQLSPGRSRALLFYLQHVGYIIQTSPDRGTVAARYAVTPRFVESWSRHLRAGLLAAGMIEPAVLTLIERMERDPRIAAIFTKVHGDTILQALTNATYPITTPMQRIFQARAGAGMILSLLVSEADPDWRSPAIHPISELAPRVGVSRMHVKRLFQDAESEGLLHRDRDFFIWSESARTFLSYVTTMEFTVLLACAATAISAASFEGSHIR